MFVASLFLVILGVGGSRAQRECYYDGNDFCINQEDILSADLLPGSFLLMDPTIQAKNRMEKIDNVTIDGSIDRALGEMDFHRKRMNEYLCHGFMAEEIFREMKTIRVKRRPDERATLMNSLPDFLGDSAQYENDNKIDAENGVDNVTVHDKLLADEGSAKYKDWLQRTTTLDDIYRHYAPHKMKKKISIRHPPRSSHVIHDHGIEEFDGEVTGYAMPAHLPPEKVGPYYDEEHMITSETGHSYHHHGGGQEHYSHPHEVIPIIHEEHYYGHPSHHEEEEYYHRPSHYKGKGHELTIKDFFEIALTALAFLAFGLFIIQLLMNITNPMTTTTTTTSDALFSNIDATRFRRGAYSSGRPVYHSSVEEFNVLSHRVLRSIEAAMVAEQDSGRCLRWSLCTDNSHSRSMSGPQRIWLPIWSLGMSWVSGRMLNRRAWPAMLESVKASILGLGGVDCSSIYPDCDLSRERVKRRRRRRK